MKEIKVVLNKCIYILYSVIENEKTNIVKMPIHLKLIYISKAIASKIQARNFIDTVKPILKCIWKIKETGTAKIILEKRDKAENQI